jgi:hypothetical protein
MGLSIMAVVAIAFLVSGCASRVSEEPVHSAEAGSNATTDTPQRRPDAILGVGLDDNHFFMPFTLVRDEDITIDIHLERTATAGNLISCKVTSGDATISSDMGVACHLSASGTGLRYYVLHIANVDEVRSHQIFIEANRGKSRT